MPAMTITPIAHRPRVAGKRLAAAAIGPLQAPSGAYISGDKPERSSPESYDSEREEALWSGLEEIASGNCFLTEGPKLGPRPELPTGWSAGCCFARERAPACVTDKCPRWTNWTRLRARDPLRCRTASVDEQHCHAGSCSSPRAGTRTRSQKRSQPRDCARACELGLAYADMSRSSLSKLSVQPSRWSARRASVLNGPCVRASSVASARSRNARATSVSTSSGSGSSQTNV
jgi:hypothetical protein